ncbi:hypothetical protein [Massilia phyllosphaerae]|uniref:hypothetical protein n=1 Tax=Massilia phyllosphaerae TaxID=3106034 RepID=UPI002B1CBFBE|nr:hypothetical protein [Massilia sp. SGZ-792]
MKDSLKRTLKQKAAQPVAPKQTTPAAQPATKVQDSWEWAKPDVKASVTPVSTPKPAAAMKPQPTASTKANPATVLAELSRLGKK